MMFSLDDVKFNEDGLVPVIVQDVLSAEVLMMADATPVVDITMMEADALGRICCSMIRPFFAPMARAAST